MSVVDFHNHYFPPEFIAAVRQGPSAFRVTDDEAGNPVLHSPGDYNVVVPGHRDLDARLAAIDAVGVDRQVITFTAPGTSIEEPERAAQLARIANDGLAAAVARHPQRFVALAHLPLNAPAAALEEMQRCLEAGFPGVMLFSNAAGVPLADRRFWPLYEEADRRGAVLYIHPTFPVGVGAMKEYMLMPLIGFCMDTTLAAAHLVFAGIPARFPGIRWVLGHLGGTIPYLVERLDRGYEAFPACRREIDRPPSEYLRAFFYDTVNFDLAALRLAYGFAGPTQLLAGSDYPHMIGSLERMRSSIAALELPEAETAAILGGNAARLLAGC